MKKIKFGFCIPIFANPGMLFFRTPAYEKLNWDSIKETTLLSEDLGYDSLFVADHLFLGKDGEIFECISTMTALGTITNKMTIIPIHLCNNFRHPGILAKTLATMSHIFNGRIELFYDYGWRETEFNTYGIDFEINETQRIVKMAEGIEIIKGLFNNDFFTFKGKFYSLNNAVCNPKPVRNIPIWMGEINNKIMVKEIVKHADVFNSMPCTVESFKEKCNIIHKECDIQGRNFSDISLSVEVQLLIRTTNDEIDRELEKYRKLKKLNNSYDTDILEQLNSTNTVKIDYNSDEVLKKEFIIGTPEEVNKIFNSFIKIGVEHFMIWFMDYPDTTGMKLFSKEIMKR